MTAKVERLVNLTVALLEARRPMTLAQIRSAIPGYGQDDPESARRMFERDKDDLRQLGVPIETLPTDAWETEWGYRIDRQAYALPPVDLSVEEVTALALALQLTDEGPGRRGFTKLAARAPDPAHTETPPAHVDVGLAALDGLAEALVERRAVRFEYVTADGSRSTRTVDPYAVAQRRGSWYLVGRDHDRDALRAFRVDRVAGTVRSHGDPDAFTVPDDLDLSAAVSGPTAEGVSVTVAASPAVGWEVARRGVVVDEREDGWRTVRIDGADPVRLLPWILGFGAELEVLAPDDLRDEVIERLRVLAGK